MHIVDEVMDLFGFERDLTPAAQNPPGKIIYKKRGSDVSGDQDYLAGSSRHQAAARTHVSLTLLDRAVLWIFENIVSPWISPSAPASSTAPVPPLPEVDYASAPVTPADPVAKARKAAEEEFSGAKESIKTFLEKNAWPSGAQIFSDNARDIARDHWAAYQALIDRSDATAEERLNYATAAYVLGKERPSFDPSVKPSGSSAVTDLPKEQAAITSTVSDASAAEMESRTPVVPEGQKLFEQFSRLYSSSDFQDVESLGSVFLQKECLRFAEKTIHRHDIADIKHWTAPSSLEIDSARYLIKKKLELEGKAEEASRRAEDRARKEKIDHEKKQFQPGEYEFREFVTKFVEHKEGNRRFILQSQGKYLGNPELLAFAAAVKDAAGVTPEQRSAADYLSKWSRNTEAAAKAAQEKDTFAWPPEPAAPPRRPVATVVPQKPLISPEHTAIAGLLSAEHQQHDRLLSLMNFDVMAFQSALEIFAQIWPSDASADVAHHAYTTRLASSRYSQLTYTDLEQTDYAIKFISAMAELKTSHDLEGSRWIQAIKENREPIIRRLRQHRGQVIDHRKIFPIADLTEAQLIRGQQLFDEFRAAYVSLKNRDSLDQLIVRDIYFSDESISYANQLYETLAGDRPLATADIDSREAAGYLLNKYRQFKSLASDRNVTNL